MSDPLTEEVRRVREEHAREFNYDLDAIVADVRRHQGDWGNPVVRLPPRKRRVANGPGDGQ